MSAGGKVFSQFIRSPRFHPTLQRLGIQPKQFWLLMDLFSKLTDRNEMMDQLGRSGFSLMIMSVIWVAVGGLASLFAFSQPEVEAYLSLFLGITIILLFIILLSEAANSLVNPVESLVLAHQPINGATYTAAKLSHLFRIVVVVVSSVNMIPAFVGLVLKQSSWLYPLNHFLATFFTGLLVALVSCSLFGYLLRFIPAQRLKAFGQFAQVFLVLGFRMIPIFNSNRSGLHLQQWLPIRLPLRLFLVGQHPTALPIRWWFEVPMLCAIGGLTALGIRSLSGDYLSRVSSIVHGSANARPRTLSGRTGAIGGRLSGSQAGRAGYEFVRRMMARDWQFRRQLATGALPGTFLMAAALFRSGRVSPFSPGFTPIHFLPHLIGFILLFVCTQLPFGSDHLGNWLFTTVPSTVFKAFARGVYSALWITFVLTPHLIFLPLSVWLWGPADGFLFTLYSVVAASLYLAVLIRFVNGVPFCKQVTTRNAAVQSSGLVLMFIAAFAAILQWRLLFQSHVLVSLFTPATAIVAVLLTKTALSTLDAAMRHGIGVVTMESTLIYSEVD